MYFYQMNKDIIIIIIIIIIIRAELRTAHVRYVTRGLLNRLLQIKKRKIVQTKI